MVLIDPPFEEAGEFARIVGHVARAARRWAGGTYAIWYPIKRLPDVAAFHAALAESGVPDIITCDFHRQTQNGEERLTGSGLIVVNPPYGFAAEAREIMNSLLPVLAVDATAHCGINVLAPERT